MFCPCKMAFEKLERRKILEREINYANKEYLGDESFQDITDLSDKLDKLKYSFMKHDSSSKGVMEYPIFHAMAQDLGIFSPLAELKMRVCDITGNTSHLITYKDCVMAILGCRSTMCQRIMKYNQKGGEAVKRPCLLDKTTPSYVSRLEFTIPSVFHSPVISFLPPPPPPSPADMGTEANTETFPAA